MLKRLSGLVAGAWLVSMPLVMAEPLSQAEVTERLDAVPVFAIVSADGTPVLANIDQEGQNIQVATFWLNQQEALSTIEQIRQSNPDVASQAQVMPLSLGYAFQVAEEQQGEDIRFQVLPDAQVSQQALTIAQAGPEGAELTEFPGVPLFYGESDQGVLTVEAEDGEVVPFFFSQTDLESALERAATENPEATATRIQVTTLEQVVGSMLDPEADADVAKIAFVPSRAALEYVQSMSGEAGGELGEVTIPAEPTPGAQ